MMLLLFVLVCSLLKSSAPQGILPNGYPYFCAPPGICTSGTTPGGGGIDPRIVTPDGSYTSTQTPGFTSCPPGRVPCFVQGPNSNCGRRLVQITNQGYDGEAQYGAYPWQAFLIGPTGFFLGSGSLLSPYHVLTAAHKVLSYVSNPSQLSVVMGVNDPSLINNIPSTSRSRAAQISIYDTFNNSTLMNDLAIVRLSTPITLLNQNSVNTICLPPASSNTFSYTNPPQRCTVSGWGQPSAFNPTVPTKLKQVSVSTTDINTCSNGFNGRVNTNVYLDKTGGQLCAGGEAQKDACFSDGGAPLVCGNDPQYTIAGVVIWGKSCGLQGVYGVYTSVAFPTYRQWIVRKITEPIT